MVIISLVNKIRNKAGDASTAGHSDALAAAGLVFLVAAAAVWDVVAGLAAAGAALLVVSYVMAYVAGGTPDGNDESG